MKFIVRISVFAAVLSCSTSVFAQPDPDRLRAAMVFNLVKFTSWPDVNRSQLKMCVVADIKIHAHLLAVNGRTVQGRELSVLYIDEFQSDCDLVIFGVDKTPQYLANDVLSIGQSKDFLEAGGMINLDVEKNRMVFDVALQRLRETEFSLSADVLALARLVR